LPAAQDFTVETVEQRQEFFAARLDDFSEDRVGVIQILIRYAHGSDYR
jgi:hypothetical protein